MLDATICYNEKKADGREGIKQYDELNSMKENGHILVTRNVPTESTLEDEFERLIERNLKTKGRKVENIAFHMSVNPGANDTPLSEAEVVNLIDEIMDKLGYCDSPYRIYKHTDIERVHYHVVSCRIGQNGKKINDSYENKKVNRIARSLAEKYGYTLGLDDEFCNEMDINSEVDSPNQTKEDIHLPSEPIVDEEDDNKKKQRTNKVVVPGFDIESKLSLTEQLKNIHKEAMTWSFSTPEQYAAILRWRFKVESEEQENGLVFFGLDKKGVKITRAINEGNIGIEASEEIIQKCISADMKKRKSQRERIEAIAEDEIKDCPSLKEYRKRMHKKGIYVVISYTEEGRPFGLTWLDRATKCAFKGSETDCNLSWLINKANMNGWILERIHRFDKTASIQKENLKREHKSRYRISTEIQRRIEQKKNEALLRKMTRNQDQRAESQSINKAELDMDPNNIKI